LPQSNLHLNVCANDSGNPPFAGDAESENREIIEVKSKLSGKKRERLPQIQELNLPKHKVDLICKVCGEQHTYSVGSIMVDPEEFAAKVRAQTEAKPVILGIGDSLEV